MAGLLPEAQARLRNYGLHDLGNRHVPDGRDGLKPVQRRILWAMHLMNARSIDTYSKKARIMGEVTGKYHPHGEASVDSAMVNMCQTRTKANTIVGMGNWGSHVDGPAAFRYIEAYLSKYAQLSFLDSDELPIVDYLDNYDGTLKEPLYLPSKLPHFLLQGCSGISYSLKVEVPPVHPQWVCDALQSILEKKKVTLPKEFNFCYGGKLLSLDPEWLDTGRGQATFRPTFKMLPEQNKIVLTSLVPNLKIESKLENLRDKDYVSAISDESGLGSNGLYTIQIKKGSDFKTSAQEIAKTLTTSMSYNFFYVIRKSEDEFIPNYSSPLAFLQQWAKWRLGFTSKVAEHKIKKINDADSRLLLLLRLIANRDKVIKLLKSAKSKADLQTRMSKLLQCNAEDAAYVLSVPISRLSNLEEQDLKAKLSTNKKEKLKLEKVKASPRSQFFSDINAAVSTL